jgi:hypothetical protein
MSDSGKVAAWMILGAVMSIPFAGVGPLVGTVLGVFVGLAFIGRHLR